MVTIFFSPVPVVIVAYSGVGGWWSSRYDPAAPATSRMAAATRVQEGSRRRLGGSIAGSIFSQISRPVAAASSSVRVRGFSSND
jgi:hypothetical protein